MNPSFPSALLRWCPFCGAEAFRPAPDEDYMQCNACGGRFYINPAAAVACIIVNSRGEILFTRRANDPCRGLLDLPGGFINNDETAEDAVCREIREELHLEVTNMRYLCSFPNQYLFRKVLYFTLDMSFVCSVADLDDITADDDVDGFLFLAPDKVDICQIAFPSIRQMLVRYRLQGPVSC